MKRLATVIAACLVANGCALIVGEGDPPGPKPTPEVDTGLDGAGTDTFDGTIASDSDTETSDTADATDATDVGDTSAADTSDSGDAGDATTVVPNLVLYHSSLGIAATAALSPNGIVSPRVPTNVGAEFDLVIAVPPARVVFYQSSSGKRTLATFQKDGTLSLAPQVASGGWNLAAPVGEGRVLWYRRSDGARLVEDVVGTTLTTKFEKPGEPAFANFEIIGVTRSGGIDMLDKGIPNVGARHWTGRIQDDAFVGSSSIGGSWGTTHVTPALGEYTLGYQASGTYMGVMGMQRFDGIGFVHVDYWPNPPWPNRAFDMVVATRAVALFYHGDGTSRMLVFQPKPSSEGMNRIEVTPIAPQIEPGWTAIATVD